MSKKLILWAVLFAAGLVTVLFRVELSRFVSDLTALLAGGSILALTAGAGLLLELYRSHR